MKLASVHFEQLIPIPGGDTVERHFYAHEGWSIERGEDGAIELTSALGKLHFVADGFAYTYVASEEAKPAARSRKPKESVHGGS